MPDPCNSLPPEISRLVADRYGMAGFCPRSACRRAQCCRGAVHAHGEPDCIRPLIAHHREAFRQHLAAADIGLDVVTGRMAEPAVANRFYEILLADGGLLAADYLLRDPATRLLARRWKRRQRRRVLPPMPLADLVALQDFGHRLAGDTPSSPSAATDPGVADAGT